MPRSKSQGVEGSVQNQIVKILRELTLTFSCRVERLCIYIYISIYLYLYLYIYIYDAILLIYFQAEARKPLRLKIDFSKPPGGASSPNIQIGWRWLEPP